MKNKIYKRSRTGLKWVGLLSLFALATGCISAKSPPTEIAEEVIVTPEVGGFTVETPAAAAAEVEVVAEVWLVSKGDNLWAISGNDEVYNVPERWPLIYKANIDQINDPDLIYPGQVFAIPRNVSASQVNAAVEHAKTRGAWAVGPIEASDREYIRNSN